MRARITAFLIVLGLFAQALALVRHNMTVLANQLDAPVSSETSAGLGGLLRDLVTTICHPGPADGGALAVLPDSGSERENPQSSCPICNGLAFAYCLTAPRDLALGVLVLVSVVDYAPFDERVSTQRFIRPQSRGPPTAV